MSRRAPIAAGRYVDGVLRTTNDDTAHAVAPAGLVQPAQTESPAIIGKTRYSRVPAEEVIQVSAAKIRFRAKWLTYLNEDGLTPQTAPYLGVRTADLLKRRL